MEHAEHIAAVKAGNDAIHQWRLNHRSQRLHLEGACLCGTHPHGRWLNGAVFNDSDLTRVDLSGAKLSGANFNRANLSGSDLRWADLSFAVLRKTNLSGADLSEANLCGADLADRSLPIKSKWDKTRRA